MTVEEVLATEIEAAVEESLETEKGFEGTEAKQEEAGEDVKITGDLNSTSGLAAPEEEGKEEGKQNDNEGASEGVDENKSGGPAGENEEGTEGESGDAQAASGSIETPAISEGVLGLAVQAGFSLSEAKSFGSEQTLLKVIQIVGEKNTPAKEKGEESQASLLSDLPKLDPEQYEPEAIETFNKMRDAIQKQQETIEQLVQGNQQSQENQAAQNEREIIAWFDGKVAGLGKQYEKTLGEGSHGSLNQGSSQHAKREEIADHINLLAAGYASTGRESPSLDVLFDQATKFVLQDEMSGVKEKELSDRLRNRAKQHVARTGSTKVGTLETAEASEKELVDKIDQQFFKNR